MLIRILAVALVWLILWYGIGALPEPTPAPPPAPRPFPVKAVLYVVDCAVAAYFILKLAGLL